MNAQMIIYLAEVADLTLKAREILEEHCMVAPAEYLEYKKIQDAICDAIVYLGDISANMQAAADGHLDEIYEWRC